MLITLGIKVSLTTHLSCVDLWFGRESPVHCISCFSLKLFHTLQRDNCSPLILTMAQPERHLSATQQRQSNMVYGLNPKVSVVHIV